MNDSENGENNIENHSDDGGGSNLPPLWARATLEDLSDFDFEAPLRGQELLTFFELYNAYQAASNEASQKSLLAEGSKNILNLLCGITSMLAGLSENDPFAPLLVFEGRRSAIISDFRHCVPLIGELASRSKNPTLRARLSDACWFLERKRRSEGLTAISAYTELAVLSGASYDKEVGVAASHEMLRFSLERALQIGRRIKASDSDLEAAKRLVQSTRRRFMKESNGASIEVFSQIDYEYAITGHKQLAIELQEFIPSCEGLDHLLKSDLWDLASAAFDSAGCKEEFYQCRVNSSDCLVAYASYCSERSFLAASEFLSRAIKRLHGLPGQKEQRKLLRKKLVDYQEESLEECSSVAYSIDLPDALIPSNEKLAEWCLIDKLFFLAKVTRSPSSQQLQRAAEAGHQSSLADFGDTVHLDGEGKVRSRTSGSNSNTNGASKKDIDRCESVRRVCVGIFVERFLQAIRFSSCIEKNSLVHILRYSPFVPSNFIHSYAQGLARFFQSDFMGATYVLVPLFETSIKHALKNKGHDVSVVNDANMTQEEMGISSLFTAMRSELELIFGEALLADMNRILLDKSGPCLRHSIAHGLAADDASSGPDAIYVCWLMLHLCMLPLFRYEKELKSHFKCL